MDSKNEILLAIRTHTGKRYEKPSITLDAISYPDKATPFAESLKAAGGTVLFLQPEEDINEVIRRHFPEAKRIASNLPDITCATFNPDDLDDPRDLNDTDLAIVKGEFAVAENGAVWITQQVKHKALYFISTNLVILVPKEEIVNNMHEAYHKTEHAGYGFSFFVSGPSKTADIEQALVFGAHGAMSVLVLFI